MKITESDLIATILGDASPDTVERVRLAVQSDDAVAREYADLERLVSDAREDSHQLNAVCSGAMAGALRTIRDQEDIRVETRTVPRVGAWMAMAASVAFIAAVGLATNVGMPPGESVSLEVPSYGDVDAVAPAFSSLDEGLMSVRAGGTVDLAADTFSDSGRIDQAVRLIATNGPVRIGVRK